MATNGQIAYCEARIKLIDATVSEILRTGAASATLSAGGTSRSYTHLDLDKLADERARWASALARLQSRNGTGIRHIGRVYR